MTCLLFILGRVDFVADPKRMNVMLTRARYAVWVVAHGGALGGDELFSTVMNFAEERGSRFSLTQSEALDGVAKWESNLYKSISSSADEKRRAMENEQARQAEEARLRMQKLEEEQKQAIEQQEAQRLEDERLRSLHMQYLLDSAEENETSSTVFCFTLFPLNRCLYALPCFTVPLCFHSRFRECPSRTHLLLQCLALVHRCNQVSRPTPHVSWLPQPPHLQLCSKRTTQSTASWVSPLTNEMFQVIRTANAAMLASMLQKPSTPTGTLQPSGSKPTVPAPTTKVNFVFCVCASASLRRSHVIAS